MEERIKIALNFLKSGQSFTVADLRLHVVADEMRVTGWSNFLNFSSISRNTSLHELQEIKAIFNSVLSISSELNEFVAGKTIKYILCYDDAGKGAVDICYEIDNNIKWIAKL
jgi:hypothetical protein